MSAPADAAAKNKGGFGQLTHGHRRFSGSQIAIIGAGLMGVGFAAVFAPAGHDVTIHDPFPDVLKSVPSRLTSILQDIGQDVAAVSRVRLCPELRDTVADADLVLEAVIEKLPLKQELFERIEVHAKPDAIFASNTSSIPITKIMARVQNKSRALGTHWFNPPYLVPLVEVIQTADTDPQNIHDVISFLNALGKVAVHVKKDVPGFLGNRMQHAVIREAISLVENGVCDAETIDLVVTNSYGLRTPVLGPMAAADLVGTDLVLDIQNVLASELESRNTPNPMLQKLVGEGELGFKTNRGFLTWTDDRKQGLRSALTEHLKQQLKHRNKV
jgi:3-hydroxybutyryl-CoA dehydrogenase